MHQSIGTTKVNEGSKVREIAHYATANFARLQLIEQFFAAALAPFLNRQPL